MSLDALLGPGFVLPAPSVSLAVAPSPFDGGPIKAPRLHGPWCPECGHEFRSKSGKPEVAGLFPEADCTFCKKHIKVSHVEPFPQVSKSQLEKFSPELSPKSGCKRRWFFKYMLHRPEPENKAAAQGIVGHEIAEDWMGEGKLPSIDSLKPKSVASRMAVSVQGIIPHIPSPKHPGLEVEAELRFEYEGVHYLGYTDYRAASSDGRRAYVDEEGKARISYFSGWDEYTSSVDGARIVAPLGVGDLPMLGDHKFTSNLDYALTPEELAVDVQAILYSHDTLQRYPEAPGVFLNWVYCERGTRNALPVRTVVTREHVEKNMRRVNEIASELIQIKLRGPAVSPDSIEANPGACHAYHQTCPHADVCNVSAIEMLGGIELMDPVNPLAALLAVGKNPANPAAMPTPTAPVEPVAPPATPTLALAPGPWTPHTMPVATPAPAVAPAASPPTPVMAVGVNPPPANPALAPTPSATPPVSTFEPTVLMHIAGFPTPYEVPVSHIDAVMAKYPGSQIAQRPVVDPLKASPVSPAPTPAPAESSPVPAPVAPSVPTVTTGKGPPKPRGARRPGEVSQPAVIGRPKGATNRPKVVTIKAPSEPGGASTIDAPPGIVVQLEDAEGNVTETAPGEPVVLVTPGAAAPAVAPRDKGFMLLINVQANRVPNGYTIIEGSRMVGAVAPLVCRDHNVPHYRAIKWGAGPGYLITYLAKMLEENPLGDDTIVTVDTRTQEGADIAPTLERLAGFVFRAS